MRISKRDANLLLVVLGLLIVLLVYFLPLANLNEETEAITAQANALKPRLAELQDHQSKVDIYNSGIEASKVIIAQEKTLYAPEIRTEDYIMYAVMLEEEIGLDISTASFTDAWVISSFQSPAEDGTAPAEYTAYGVNMTVVCKMGYEEFKQAVNRINETADKTLLDNVSVSYDPETGELAGTMTISKIFLADGKYEYVPTPVEFGQLGTLNPFGTVAPQDIEVETTTEPEPGN